MDEILIAKPTHTHFLSEELRNRLVVKLVTNSFVGSPKLMAHTKQVVA